MSLSSLQTDLVAAMKARDAVKTGTIRFLISEIRNHAINRYGASWETGLTDDDVMTVIAAQAKKHRESILAFGNAGRTDLVDKEQQELDVIQAYLPAELSDEEIRSRLMPLVGGETNFGLVMKRAMAELKGQADGGRVSAILKDLLKS